jgi:coiled-coil domain-containing protein 77
VRAREEELVQLAAVHQAAKGQYEGRACELEARCARLAESCAALELRRARDAEGGLADVSALRKQLSAIDRRLLQMRLMERLEDDERLDRLLDQLGGKGAARGGGVGPPARPGSSGGGSVKSAMSGQLAAARGRLAELEEELQRKQAGAGRRGR